MPNADNLLNEMKQRAHPNCTLYLIWHYLKQGDVEYALAEYHHDSDKLGESKRIVEEELGIT
jgi:hypothetical protein